ncbi:hypothetical protein CIHG_05136 [Coccidioides immitis H538.4]|uniref:Prolyl 4-hydroxylase alpha subunit Fe(2+) 2OG dioxygenase domain-containing protein n=1 Tax=Coccidioides immitis H538.4 TaxID=396776 RepID=A0A0J8RQ51_COCIT|nr:hypothetical protein CIHG_05136 [Coccidioides immitis H538.4]
MSSWIAQMRRWKICGTTMFRLESQRMASWRKLRTSLAVSLGKFGLQQYTQAAGPEERRTADGSICTPYSSVSLCTSLLVNWPGGLLLKATPRTLRTETNFSQRKFTELVIKLALSRPGVPHHAMPLRFLSTNKRYSVFHPVSLMVETTFRGNYGWADDIRIIGNNYAPNDVPIPDTFLTVAPLDAKPIAVHPIDFSASPLPQYKNFYAVILDNVLSPSECTQMISLAEQSVAEPDPVTGSPWKPALIYQGQFFKPHCDGPTIKGNQRTFYTLHLYLNDSTQPNDEHGQLVEGATTFCSSDEKKRFDVNPKAGSVLIFQHRSLYHSGDLVLQGVKYTMRTDIYYEPDDPMEE